MTDCNIICFSVVLVIYCRTIYEVIAEKPLLMSGFASQVVEVILHVKSYTAARPRLVGVGVD